MTKKMTMTFKLLMTCMIGLFVFGSQNAIAQNTMYVNDGKIYSSCNEEIVMRGVNEMFVWSSDKTGVTTLPEIAKTGSNAVRLVWTTTDGTEAEFDALVRNSIANNMIPVAELHDATGDFSKLPQLLTYWKRPAILATIQKYKKWIIVNIGNEIGNGSESTAQWVNYYKDAITQLRDAGVDTPLMIDCGTWGNQESYFLEGGNELLEHDPLKNIIFSIHTYWTGNGDKPKLDRLENMIADAKRKKLPYIVGEGPQLASSPNECQNIFPYKQMIKRLEEEGIGWLAWSWGLADNNDCGSPNSVFDITSDGKFGNWATTFAEDICVADPNSIKNTSIIPPSMKNGGVACGDGPGPEPEVNYIITASAGVGGTINPSGNTTIKEGANQTYTITANNGFAIDGVTVDGAGVGALGSYTFSNVRTNHTIAASFKAETTPTPTAQQAYPNGTPHAIPGTIESFNFDIGGQGIAYNDTTTGNTGSGPRADENVDTEFRTTAGNVGWIATGEWLEYTVNVGQTSSYTIETQVASNATSGAYHIELDGNAVTSVQNVASTGGWGAFVTQTISNVSLTAGQYVMRVYMDGGSFNLGAMKFTAGGTTGGGNTNPIAAATANTTSGQAPLAIVFNASGSSDADGDNLSYSWNFGDNTTGSGATPSHTYTVAGNYSAIVTVTDGNGGSDQASVAITVTPAGGGGGPIPSDCAFGTPRSSALPSGSQTYNNMHVLGTGGPDLSNAINFGINWGLENNGLWQLSMSTNDGKPNWWINLLDHATQNFNSAQPSISLSGTGFPGLDGDYYVNFVGTDFAMVSKTGNFSIYLSNSSTAPNCSNAQLKKSNSEPLKLTVYPNPSSDYFTLQLTGNIASYNAINLYDINGKQVRDLSKDLNAGELIFGRDLSQGVYFVRLVNTDGIDFVTQVIKN